MNSLAFAIFHFLTIGISAYTTVPFKRIDQWMRQPSLYRNFVTPQPVGLRPLYMRDFLMSHSFNTGLDINHGKDRVVDGFLNIRNPLNPKKLWDMKGFLRTTRNHVWYHYGHLLRPINKYNLTEAAVAELELNPFLRHLRSMAVKKPVAILPKDFIPLRCKPPLCNPYLHTWAFSVEHEPGNDVAINGLLDFPIPSEDPDVELRFPLEGTLIHERVPLRAVYGQHMSSVNPFKKMWNCQNCLTGIK